MPTPELNAHEPDDNADDYSEEGSADSSAEGEAVEDDDDDVPHMARVATRPTPAPVPRRPAPAPRTPAEPRTPAMPRSQTMINENVERDLESIFAELGSGVGACKVTLTRLEPYTHPRTGEKISGHLDTYQRAITPDEIKQRFGGGRFQVIIMGPRRKGPHAGTGSEIRHRQILDIAGPPKDPNADKDEEKTNTVAQDVAQRLLDREERDREREDRKLEAMRAEIRESNKTILTLVANMNAKPAEDPNNAVLTLMREENRRREQELKEELQRREAADRRDREERERRWKEEREEQRRRDEEAQRRHEVEMKRQEQQVALQLKQLEVTQQQNADRMKAEASSQKEMTTMMLSFMQKNDSEKESRSQQMMQMQIESLKQTSENSTRFMEMQTKFLMEQLKGKDDFFGVFEKFQMFKDMMNPPADEEPAWSRGIDKVVEGVQGLIPGLAMLTAGKGGLPMTQQQQQPGQPQRRLAPGSVAVVEDYEEEAVEVQPETAPATQPPKPAKPEVVEAEVDEAANPATDFQTYEGVDANEEVFIRLIQNLDLALQRELSVDEIVERCFAQLPDEQKAPLQMAPPELILGYIEQFVPANWRVRALDAEDTIRAVIEKVKESA